MKRRPKYLKTTNFRPTLQENDKLWAKAIKLRAGMKSEHGPADGYLAAHHIIGKDTYALRFNLDNGVCITTGQHSFVAHRTGRSARFKEWALKKRGVTEDQLKLTSRNKVDLFGVKLYLENKIKEFEGKEYKKTDLGGLQ